MFSKGHISFSAILILTFLFLGTEVFAKASCGTSQFIRNLRQYKEHPDSRKIALGRATVPCSAESFYDTVYTKKTEHFQIFYTLSGPNQTTEEFVDSVAANAEFAYQAHTKFLGLRPPLGDNVTFHYQMNVEDELYPIEIIDIDQIRGTQFYTAGRCHGCFGLTTPSDSDPHKSELIIDNDFRYTPEYNAIKDTLIVDGKKCIYDIADQELENDAHGYSYADQWDKGIRVTLIHELYHAVQLRYLDLTNYWTFWFEASASGIEEILAPDIDDYFSYLPRMFSSMGTPLDMLEEDYGVGIFLIYLYNHIDKDVDKFIWESFEKSPNASFREQFEKFTKKKGLSTDSIFHDFATRLAFSGKRSSYVDSTQWITDDEKNWPEFKYLSKEKSDLLTPNLEDFSYQYYAYGKPDFEGFSGKATLAAFNGNQAKIYPIKSSNEADSLYIALDAEPAVDSIIWMFSRFGKYQLPTLVKDPTLRVYPTPWRSGNLCFTPLPQSKNFIEIRTRRGDLVTREKYDRTTHCIDENRVKKLMVPGVYRFRAGNSGKTQDFIVIY